MPKDCTHCQEWEICPFHPKSEPPPTERQRKLDTRGAPCAEPPYAAGVKQRWVHGVGIQGLRLLGQDDPEVSDDLIYLDESTGGLVAVPQRGGA